MTKEEFEKLSKEQMIVAYNQLKDDYSSLFDELEQEKEKNKDLELAYFLQKDLFNDDNYIHKDKIREKIKECEHIIHNAKLKYGQNYYIYDDVIYAIQEIKLYKELLEEN